MLIYIIFIENPASENVSNSGILKPLGYNKNKDDNIKINKDYRSDSLSRSQYNKVRLFCFILLYV